MIDLKTEDGIAVVTLAHGKASALDIELCEALTKCFEELRAPEIRAVVLTGQGRIFSAGVDLVRLSSGGALGRCICEQGLRRELRVKVPPAADDPGSEAAPGCALGAASLIGRDERLERKSIVPVAF